MEIHCIIQRALPSSWSLGTNSCYRFAGATKLLFMDYRWWTPNFISTCWFITKHLFLSILSCWCIITLKWTKIVQVKWSKSRYMDFMWWEALHRLIDWICVYVCMYIRVLWAVVGLISPMVSQTVWHNHTYRKLDCISHYSRKAANILGFITSSAKKTLE